LTPEMIVLSKATYVSAASVATAAATYSFVTKGYKPGRQVRMIDSDVVKNQNGKFRYVYDNGPGFRSWQPFQIVCDDNFQSLTAANAAEQFANLLSLWNHPGPLGMKGPDGTFSVIWAPQALEPGWRQFPGASGATVEYQVTVQFDEA
jgi:hypothetical protein